MLTSKDSNKHWEKYGETEPYYGVLSDEKFLKDNLNLESIDEFFKSGETYVHSIMETVAEQFPDFQIRTAVDFGCGVGRLIIPFSKLAHKVIGLDVSTHMLAEAQTNIANRNIDNISFAQDLSDLDREDRRFNFVHSVLVFQHIPVQNGEKIITELLRLLDIGGVGVLEFPIIVSDRRRLANSLFQKIPLAYNIFNLVKGRNFFTPAMQFNEYPLNYIFRILANHNCKRVFVTIDQDNRTTVATLFFRKSN